MISNNSKQNDINPRTWSVATLGDENLFSIGAGGTPSTSQPEFWNGNIPWVTPTDLSNLGTAVISETARTITPDGVANSSAKPLPAGTVVLSTRAPIGYASILGQDMSINQGCKGIVVKDPSRVSNEYLYFNLLTQTQKMNELGSGSTFRELSLHNLKSIEVPLPSISEQKRMATILGSLRDLIQQQHKVIDITKEFRASLLDKIFRNGTREESSKKSEIGLIPQSWEIISIDQIAQVKGGKRLPKGHNFINGDSSHPYLRIVDFKNDSIDVSNLKYLSEDDFQILKNYMISSKDCYISIAGTIGICGVIQPDLDGAILTENAAKLVFVNDNVYNKFVVLYLSSQSGQEQIRKYTAKSTQPKLALVRIKQIYVPIPSSIEEQREIVNILTVFDKKLDLEERKLLLYEELFEAMLENLMSGKIDLKNIEIN